MAVHLLTRYPERSDHALKPQDFNTATPSGEFCASCGDMLALNEEIFLAEIVYATYTNGHINCFNVLDDDGDLEYEPLYFQWGCMEQLVDELKDFIENRPPIPDEAHSILKCNHCHSGIRSMEKFCRIRCGELRPSARQPDNNRIAVEFYDISTEEAICLSCLYHVNTECLELWGGGVTQNGACEEGIHARCWRWGSCPCPHRTAD